MEQLVTGIVWTGLGLMLYQFVPGFPKLLGRGLYWVGVPLQVLALARASNFSNAPWFPPLAVVVVLFAGLGASVLCLQGLRPAATGQMATLQWPHPFYAQGHGLQCLQCFNALRLTLAQLGKKVWPKHRHSRGSFILASILGNTMFIGLAIAPSLVNTTYISWIVLYGVVHYLLGSYGLGVLLASHFGRCQQQSSWLAQLQDLMTVPALWAFGFGIISHSVHFPAFVEWGLQAVRWTGVPAVFLLLGMQLAKLQGMKSFQVAILPAAIKMVVMPVIAGLGLTLLGVSGDARLAIVLMAGMPTNSANLILAEEYDLDRQLTAATVLLSTIGLPLLLPLWLTLF